MCLSTACCCVVAWLLQVYVDLKQVESGSLYDDFDMLPPKTIKVGAQQLVVLVLLVCLAVCTAE
jgi:hypothetical protein